MSEWTRGSGGNRPDMPAKPARPSWRVVDIVTAAVLAVVVGLLFLIWNGVGYGWFNAMDALTPGLGGLAVGIWLLGGVLGGLIIRKPGAAVFVEVLAAVVSMLVGTQWGAATFLSGLVQGLGAELVFLLVRYRRFTLPVAMLAGVGAGMGAWVFEFVTGNIEKPAAFNITYAVCIAASGAVLAGLLGWTLVKALASTGALHRFAAGREAERI